MRVLEITNIIREEYETQTGKKQNNFDKNTEVTYSPLFRAKLARRFDIPEDLLPFPEEGENYRTVGELVHIIDEIQHY